MRHSSVWLAAGRILLVVILASSIIFLVPGGVKADEVRKAVEAANAQWAAAFNRGDAAAVAAFYTESAILMPPDRQIIRGRQGIQEYWQVPIQRGLKDGVLTTMEVHADGNTAYEIGGASFMFHAKDQAPKPISSKYVVVWKRQADGSWKLHVDIWNSLPAK